MIDSLLRLLDHLKAFLWRQQPDVPPRPIKLTESINQYTGKPYTPRYFVMAELYNGGFDIETIAASFNVTRERVRQCLWKAHRLSRENAATKKLNSFHKLED